MLSCLQRQKLTELQDFLLSCYAGCAAHVARSAHDMWAAAPAACKGDIPGEGQPGAELAGGNADAGGAPGGGHTPAAIPPQPS